ncbi:serine carboxypeptidase s28 family protein, putative, partial [Ichthyophthirius multifiliis]
IIFYCGNEGPIEMFYKNTGFVTQILSKELKALVLYMEHRYFGESQPFGDEKTSLQKGNNQYLTSIQALSDYVEFLIYIKKSLQCQEKECPIIAVGGSYGGMLAAWIRMKFPNLVDASLAASAPIFQFLNRENLDQTKYFQIITNNYPCRDKIKTAYQILQNLLNEKNKILEQNNIFQQISQAMGLCQPLKNNTDVLNLRNYMDNAYSYMAMTNYPQETTFLKHLPPWPANFSCIFFQNITQQSSVFDLFSAVRNSTRTLYDFDQKNNCADISQADQTVSDDNMEGWDILSCADMVLPMFSNGKTDMFYNSTWDLETYKQNCRKAYGVSPNPNWALNFYGGRNDQEMKGFSNIFFSNGMLDPWSGGSPTQFINENLPVFYMEQAAHHNDLRLPAQGDPQSVIQGRKLEIFYIKKWIRFYENNNNQSFEEN